jgi:putative endonuclease
MRWRHNMFYVYVLQSVKFDKKYIGFTDDLKRRFEEHNSKKGGDFTRKNGPWKLIFYECHINKRDAQEMEQFYKSGYGREVLQKKLQHYLGNKSYSEIV